MKLLLTQLFFVIIVLLPQAKKIVLNKVVNIENIY
jgi:hypothetical protein